MSDANALDAAALGPYLEEACAGFFRPAGHRKVQLRPIEPDLSPEGRKRTLRAARQAAGRVAQIGAPGRPRVPRHEGAGRQRRAGAERAVPLRRGDADRPHVLRHVVSRRPHLLGSGAARNARQCRPRGDLRCHERDARRSFTTSMSRASAWRISASRETISNGSSAAGRASTEHRRPARSSTWRA